ncbi:hypothetical protein ANCDUO_18542 [Ancylostoma duodenale]|uniref:Uncharacterized protein n=1 Tax=Ancylostoma duodenale TaxID=51022 RepID=A0A0C2C523_9BILA|nr:hypothetical protein ANCDUO_18542 [Ancylostoma duodenale]
MSDDEYRPDDEQEEEYEEGGGDDYGYGDDQEEQEDGGGYDYDGNHDYEQGEPEEYEPEPYEEEAEPEYEDEPPEDNDVEEHDGVDLRADEDDGGPVVEEQESAFATNAEEPGEGGGGGGGMGSLVKGALDGFGGSSFGDIIGSISKIAGEQGGLSNIMSSGGMETIVQKMLGEAAHRFLGINPETGAIIGAIAGNIIFNMGGRGNSLTGIGKIILDNIISGKYKRDVHPFVPPVPTPGAATFGLNFYEEREKCLNNKVLFEDPEFPATDRSIYYKTPPDQHIEWKRPGVRNFFGALNNYLSCIDWYAVFDNYVSTTDVYRRFCNQLYAALAKFVQFKIPNAE